MVNCCVLGCKSRSERCDENVTSHSFPSDDARNNCISATGRLNWEPNKFSRICSKHFEARYFRKTLKRVYVMKSATPNLFVHDTSIDIPTTSSQTTESMEMHHQNGPLKELCTDNRKRKLLKESSASNVSQDENSPPKRRYIQIE